MDRQLELGQYKMHQIIEDMDAIDTEQNLEYLLEDSEEDMAAGTEQTRIAGISPTDLEDPTSRYDGVDVYNGSPETEQVKLDVGVSVSREQAEIFDYNQSSRVASD